MLDSVVPLSPASPGTDSSDDELLELTPQSRLRRVLERRTQSRPEPVKFTLDSIRAEFLRKPADSGLHSPENRSTADDVSEDNAENQSETVQAANDEPERVSDLPSQNPLLKPAPLAELGSDNEFSEHEYEPVSDDVVTGPDPNRDQDQDLDSDVDPIDYLKSSNRDKERTERETQRLSRTLELAPEAARKKISMTGFLSKFKRPRASEESQNKKTEPTEAEPSTLPIHASSTLAKALEVPKPLARPTISPRRLGSYLQSFHQNADEDDLEIVPPTKFDRLGKPLQQLATNARINPYGHHVASTKLTQATKLESLKRILAAKQREQIVQDRAERMAAAKARGFFMTEDEKRTEDELQMSLLERERKREEELRLKEREENDEDFHLGDESVSEGSVSGDDESEDENEEAGEDQEEDLGEDLEENLEEDLEDLEDLEDQEEDLEDLEDLEETPDEALEENEEGEMATQADELVRSRRRVVDSDSEDELATALVAPPSQLSLQAATALVVPPSQLGTQTATALVQSPGLRAGPPDSLSQFLDPTPAASSTLSPRSRMMQLDRQLADAIEQPDLPESTQDMQAKLQAMREMFERQQEELVLSTQLSQSQTQTQPFRPKPDSRAKAFVEDEAVESDDEYAGFGGGSEDEDDKENTYNLDGLVDDARGEKLNANELSKLHAERERVADEQAANQLMENVVNGGWRKRKSELGDDLDDDHLHQDYYRQMKLRRQERRRQRALEDDRLANLANNPKAGAFLNSMAEETRAVLEVEPEKAVLTLDKVRESLSFLDEKDDGQAVEEEDIVIGLDIVEEQDEEGEIEDRDPLDLLQVSESVRSVSMQSWSRPRRIVDRLSQTSMVSATDDEDEFPAPRRTTLASRLASGASQVYVKSSVDMGLSNAGRTSSRSSVVRKKVEKVEEVVQKRRQLKGRARVVFRSGQFE